MSKLALGLLAFALIGIGVALAAVLDAQAVGAGLAVLGVFLFIPAGMSGAGAAGDGGD